MKKIIISIILMVVIFIIGYFIWTFKFHFDMRKFMEHEIVIAGDDIYNGTASSKDLLRYGTAKIYLNKKEFDYGIYYVNEAIKKEPNNPNFYIQAAGASIYAGEKEKAVNYLISAEKILDKLKDIHNKSYHYFNIAQRYSKLKMYEDSLRNYKKCLELQQDDKIYNKDGTYAIDKDYRQSIINHIQKIEKYLEKQKK